jgi:hypothetical protein
MATAGADIVARMILQTGNVTSGVASMSSKLRAEAEGIAASNAKIGSSAKKAANEVNQSSLAANKMSYNWGTMFRGAEGSMGGFFGRMDSGTTKLSLLERTTSRVSGVMGTLKSKVAGAATAIGSMDMMSSMLIAGAGLGILAFFAKATQAAGDFEDQWTTFGITMGKTGSDTSSIMSQWGSTYQSIQDTTGRSQTDIMSGLDKLSIAGVKSTGLMTRSMDDLGGAAFQTHNSMGTLEDAFQRNVQSTGLQQRSLKALGLNMDDLSKVSGKSASDITKQWKTMTASQKAALLDQAMEYKDGKSANEKFKESYQGLLQGAKNAFQGIEIAVGNTILPILVPALKTAAAWATNFAKDFSKAPGPIKDIVVAIGVLVGGLLTLGGMAAILKPILTPLKAIGSAIQSVGGFVKTAIIKIGEYIASLDLIPKIKETTIYQKVVTQGGSPVTPTLPVTTKILSTVESAGIPLISGLAGALIGTQGMSIGSRLGAMGMSAVGSASRGLLSLGGDVGGNALMGANLPGNPISNFLNGQPLADTGQLQIAGGDLYNSIAGQFNSNTPGSAASQVGVFNKDWGNLAGQANGFQNYLKGGVDSAKSYIGGASGNTQSWVAGAVGNTGKALGGVGSWISGGIGSMFGGASAADGKPKPSIMSDITGKNGLLDMSTLHLPSAGDILKTIKTDLHIPKFKIPSAGDILKWIQTSLHIPNFKIPTLGQILKWIQDHIPKIDWKIPTLGQILKWIQDHIPKITWKIPSWNDIASWIKGKLGWLKFPNISWSSLSSWVHDHLGWLHFPSISWSDLYNMIASKIHNFIWPSGPGGVIGGAIHTMERVHNVAVAAKNAITHPVQTAQKMGSAIGGVVTNAGNYIIGAATNTLNWLTGRGPNNDDGPRGPIDMLKGAMSGFKFEDYPGHKKSFNEVLTSGAGNCFDLTTTGMTLASILGIPSSMVWGSWKGGSHVWGSFGGQQLDFARDAIDHTLSPPPRGPGNQSNESSRPIIVNNIFKGPVYGLPDFEDQVEDKTVKALNKHLGGIM